MVESKKRFSLPPLPLSPCVSKFKINREVANSVTMLLTMLRSISGVWLGNGETVRTEQVQVNKVKAAAKDKVSTVP